jgi:hypothetical protein
MAYMSHDREIMGDEEVCEAHLPLEVYEQVDYFGLDGDI